MGVTLKPRERKLIIVNNQNNHQLGSTCRSSNRFEKASPSENVSVLRRYKNKFEWLFYGMVFVNKLNPTFVCKETTILKDRRYRYCFIRWFSQDIVLKDTVLQNTVLQDRPDEPY